jgi:enterobactin synthetase component D
MDAEQQPRGTPDRLAAPDQAFEELDLRPPLPGWCGFALLRDRGAGGSLPADEQELAVLSPRATPRRRRQFLLGRLAARIALRRAGCRQPPPILRGPRGEPLQPRAWLVSITHSGDLAAAIAAHHHRCKGLGIDLERSSRRLSLDVSRTVGLPEERTWIGNGPGAPRRLLMLFTAKEALYKALYPRDRMFLGFRDVRLQWQESEHRFQGELLRASSHAHPEGWRFQVQMLTHDEIILATLIVPAS